MKITYIIDSLAYKGGAERIISEKMNFLAENAGYEVSVITCFQFPQENVNSYYLSGKVRQIDLCIPIFRQYSHHYPMRVYFKWKYGHELRSRLAETVNAVAPDIVVGVSYALANVVCSMKCRAAKVIESHEARPFTLSGVQYRTSSAVSSVFNALYRQMYLRTVEKHADVVVTLTRKDKMEWRRARRVVTIPNFSSMSVTRLSSCESKKVIAVGRCEWQKGYDRLIDVWKLVTAKHPDWQLHIYGDGALRGQMEDTIRREQLGSVAIHPFTPDISSKYAESSICVLTSRFEGFSLVLLEALRHGVPCVAYNCPFGPEDVVDDGKCGYIVEDGDMEAFADRLCFLMENINVRKAFSAEAMEKAKTFDKETIMRQWTDLFEGLAKKTKEVKEP